MLLYLLYPLHDSVAVLNVTRYITFRTAAASLSALALPPQFGYLTAIIDPDNLRSAFDDDAADQRTRGLHLARHDRAKLNVRAGQAELNLKRVALFVREAGDDWILVRKWLHPKVENHANISRATETACHSHNKNTSSKRNTSWHRKLVL